MIVTEEMMNPILRDIDVLYIEGKLPLADCDDLTKTIAWLIGKPLNESNISYVVNSLRGFKTVMDESIVSSVIKKFKSLCGGYL